jgi:hypothetical protein
MTQSEKYRLVFFNVSRGTEFTVQVRGAENFAKATKFLDQLLGSVSASDGGIAYYVTDDRQFADFQVFATEQSLL